MLSRKNSLFWLPIPVAILFAIWILKVFQDISRVQDLVGRQMHVVQELGEIEKEVRDLRSAFILTRNDGKGHQTDWGLLYAAYWKRTGSLDLSSLRRDFIDPQLARADALISKAALIYASSPDGVASTLDEEARKEAYLTAFSEALSQIKGAAGIVRSQITRQYTLLEGKWYQLKILIWVSCLFAFMCALLLNGYQRARAEERRMKHDLHASESRFIKVFENANMGIALLDEDGRIEQVNPALVKLTGYSPRALAGMTLSELIHSEDQLVTSSNRIDGHDNEEASTSRHLRIQRKDGGTFWARVTLMKASREDDRYSFALIEDITSRKHYEEGLIDAKNRAEEMARIKSVFLSNMHHEIRTPLSVIMVGASLLKEDAREDQRPLIDDIQTNGKRLLDMLDAVLQFAQIEEGDIEINLEKVNLNEQVTSAVNAMKPMAEAQNLRLTFTPSRSRVSVEADRNCLQRIIHELVGNAIKFTPEGEVRIEVIPEGDSVLLQVEDTGIGIDEAFMPHLFEAFRQESVGDTRRFEGAGLGLAVTRQLVTMMGGAISVTSTKHHGSRFTVRFPARTPSEAEDRPPVRHGRSVRRNGFQRESA